MIFVRRVAGRSMEPYLTAGQVIVSTTTSPSVGDVAIVQRGAREVIKRVVRIRGDQYWLEGDNPAHSTDSRDFGWIDKSAILGTMKFHFAHAVNPPKPRSRYGVMFGWIAAAVMIGFVLVHLFRIDTFVPELSLVFGDHALTAWVASLIVITEVCALPFLMRIKLSPLAQYVSGASAVVVPLAWLLIAVWTFGSGVSTAQLGEFVLLPSTWLLIIMNVLWLVFSYYTIWALGYDNRPGERQSFVHRWLGLSK